jgi:hypothetical protein
MIDLYTSNGKLFRIAREAGDGYFDPQTGLCLIGRNTLWYAAGLLFDSHEEWQHGSALMDSVGGGRDAHACDDARCCGCGRLSTSGPLHLRAAIGDDLSRAAQVYWRDGNVNHPLGAYASLILGGECCGAPWATELGYSRLLEFQTTTGDRRFRLHRQAEMSEYNSLTYTALDLVFLGLIAEYARDARARSLGLWLEHRLWLDVALHFHAPSMQFAGPHSRSYQEDSTTLPHGVVSAAGRSLY